MRSIAHWRPSLDGTTNDRALGAEAHPGLGGPRSDVGEGVRR